MDVSVKGVYIQSQHIHEITQHEGYHFYYLI